MRTNLCAIRFVILTMLVFWNDSAWAAITCSAITSPSQTIAYVPGTAAMNITQSSFTMTCQRNAGGDATTITYGVRNDNGINETGFQNRARLGATANYVNYDLFANAGCTTVWRNNAANDIVDTIPVLTGFLPASKITNFWICVPGSQLGRPAGTYTDTVTMTARLGAAGTGAVLNTGAFAVSILTPAVCTFAAPANLVFTYTAFGPATTASISYNPTCTLNLPYSMALDATVGVVNGLQYQLALNTTNTGGSNPLASTGTGGVQSFFINGTMPALQAGTCATASCSGATSTRTLTITY